MKIESYRDLTGPVVRELREAKGMTLDEFWLPLGISRQAGDRYEREINSRLKKPMQLLIYMTRVLDVLIQDDVGIALSKIPRRRRVVSLNGRGRRKQVSNETKGAA